MSTPTITLPAFRDHPARAAIRRAGLSLHQVKEYLGLAYNGVWELLAGRRNPTPEQERKLSELVAAIEGGTLEVR